MTKHLKKLATALQRQLLDGPWPPDKRVLVDAWSALYLWSREGDHVFRLRPGLRAPPIAPDLPLATAPLRRAAACYILKRAEWIILARVLAKEPIPVNPDRVLAFSAPLLVYTMERENGALSSGYFNLLDQPTPRHLVLSPGITLTELGPRKLAKEELGEEGLRLAVTLPWFFSTTLFPSANPRIVYGS